jgi:beta-glucosidase
MPTTNDQRLINMTIEEKVSFLSGKGLWRTLALKHHNIDDIVMTDGTYGVRYDKKQIEEGASWSVDDFFDVVNQQADTVESSESVFGLSEPATCFPNGSSIACSWDTELLTEMGKALAVECQHYNVDLLLGPGINIRRTPLAGRGYEYYSEDPILSGELAAGLINGLQSNGVGASLKHFACNNSEYKRTEMDSVIEERALREIYLSGYKRAIDKSNPWTVMSSYNRLNGVQAAEDNKLLNDILRDEWGYKGLVVSDWYGIKDRPASLLAGNDLAMPESELDKSTLLLAVQQGKVSLTDVDLACSRVLTLIDKVHALRQTNVNADFSQSHKLAQRLASESLVLLKNERNILPLQNDTHKIGVFGLPAQTPVIQGSGCATTRPYFLDCPLEEIIDVAGENFDIRYAPGTSADNSENSSELEKAKDLAKEMDVAVIYVSTAVGWDGENGDRQNLDIIPEHQKLIEALSEVQKNIVVVVANSDAVVMPWLDKTTAVIETFFAGQGMGRAVAEALFGHVNPSGKLTVTVPNCIEETPAYLTYPGENNRHYYSEGIYVGYRYYDKRKMEPLFPFGFGLSYTQFKYSNIRLSESTLTEGKSVAVSFDITNTGSRHGKEIAQVYLSAPDGLFCREKQSLKGFAKVSLDPGETKQVSIQLNWDDFCYYNPEAKRWLAEAAVHSIIVAKSSRQHELQADITVQPIPYYKQLQTDSTLVELLETPPALANVISLIETKSKLSSTEIYKKLTTFAPNVFFGMLRSLNDVLGLDISEQELKEALIINDIN